MCGRVLWSQYHNENAAKMHHIMCVMTLSMGPTIERILEQWDAIIQFVAELAKDPRKVPKSINYKRVYMMLGPKKKLVNRVSLEFLNHIIPVFEMFLLLFQKKLSSGTNPL